MDAKPPSANWRESDAIQQARVWLAQINDPLWPGYTESEWAELLHAVLAERDLLGEWLQRYLDADAASDEDEDPNEGLGFDPFYGGCNPEPSQGSHGNG